MSSAVLIMRKENKMVEDALEVETAVGRMGCLKMRKTLKNFGWQVYEDVPSVTHAFLEASRSYTGCLATPPNHL